MKARFWNLVCVKSVKADFVVAMVVSGLGASSFFIKSGKEVDSVAANFSRALGARPIGMLYPRRGVARPLGLWY